MTQLLKTMARKIRGQGSTADTLFDTAEPAAMLDLISQSQNAVVNNNEADLFAQNPQSTQGRNYLRRDRMKDVLQRLPAVESLSVINSKKKSRAAPKSLE